MEMECCAKDQQMLHVARWVKDKDWNSMRKSRTGFCSSERCLYILLHEQQSPVDEQGWASRVWGTGSNLGAQDQAKAGAAGEKSCRAAQRKPNLPALCLPQTVAINLLLPPSADILINYEGKREVPQMKRERLCSFIFMDLDKRELDRDLEK